MSNSPSREPFRPFAYLQYAKTRIHGAAHQLALSGVGESSREDLEALGFEVEVALKHEEGSALHERWKELLGARYGVPTDHLAWAVGTSGAIFDLLAATATQAPERDWIAVEDPAYGAFASAASLLGLRVEPLVRDRERDYGLDLDRLDQVCARAPAAVCLTNLHNPSGVALDAATVDGIHAIAAARGVWVLLDEVYRDILPGDVGTSYRPNGRVVTCSSLTKVYGVAGARAGFVFAPPELLARTEAINEVVYGVPPSPSVGVAVAGLEAADALLARSRRTARRARAVMDHWIASTERVSWVPPAGGITGLVHVDGLTDSMTFAERLRSELDVQVMPGAFFGAEGAIRVSFGLPPGALQKALEMLTLGIGALAR